MSAELTEGEVRFLRAYRRTLDEAAAFRESGLAGREGRSDGANGRAVLRRLKSKRAALEKREAEALYRSFGKAVRTLPAGWRILVLSSHTEFERAFGRSAEKKRKLYNGMLKCDAFFYHGGGNN